ncbi:MAG: hypothetical protein ABR602_12035, partial [Gemmatimonadales bacterium]
MQGSLSAVGTAAAPIRFLGEQPSRGYWRGITFNSSAAANELTHVEVAHGGGGGAANPANVTVDDFDRLRLTNALLRESAGVGLYVGQDADLPGFSMNVLRDNAGPGIRLSTELLGALDTGSDYTTGNGQSYLDVYAESVNRPQTWRITAAPIRLSGSVTIWSSVTIVPGARLMMGAGAGLTVSGSLNAVGTAAAPIRFLGEQPSRGYWRGITFNSSAAANELTHVEV